MPVRLGKPEAGAPPRKITSTEAEVAGLNIHGGWMIAVAASGKTTVTAPARGLIWGPESLQAKRLEAHWEVQRSTAKPKTPPPAPKHAMRAIVSVEVNDWNKLRRIEVLECGHKVFALVREAKRKRRHCVKCADAEAVAS